MKRRKTKFKGTVYMLPDLKKIHIMRDGCCVGSIYRWKGWIRVRGSVKGDTAKLFGNDGSVKTVIQKKITLQPQP